MKQFDGIEQLKFEKISIEELDANEMVKTNGGITFGVGTAILIGLAIAAGTEIMGDWQNFKAGFSGKPYIE